MSLPLEGVRVLDLTQALSGPFATMILADLGAEIVKIERPSGDLTRSTPPHYVEGTSVYFISNNRGKKSVVLDLKDPEQKKEFFGLVAEYDVLIDNFAPGVVDRLGIGHEELEKVNPAIISCSITGFGSDAPDPHRRAVDLVVQAAAGGMSITGFDDSPPARAGVPTADLSAGLFAVIGVLSALNERTRTGRGRRVETSLYHSQLSLLNYVATYAQFSGQAPGPMGSGHLGTVPSQAFRTQDGWIVIDAGFDKHFQALCEVIRCPELSTDDRFTTRAARSENREPLIEGIQERLLAGKSHDWEQQLQARGIPCSTVNDVLTAVTNDDARTYGSMRKIEFGGRTVEGLDTPVWFSGSGPRGTDRAPELGEHNDVVLAGNRPDERGGRRA